MFSSSWMDAPLSSSLNINFQECTNKEDEDDINRYGSEEQGHPVARDAGSRSKEIDRN